MDNLLNSLNPAQRDAVCAPPGHLLVLAGAGSGKTRVLVHRIAWLLHQENIMPHNILAVTFTNKAATEMRGRIESLLGANFHLSPMWVGTFHGLAHRLLRQHFKEAALAQDFQILDADDQTRVVKRLIQAMMLDEEKWAPKAVTSFINSKKDAGLRPEKVVAHDPYSRTLVKIYESYEAYCKRNNLVDFTELLLRAYELLRASPDLLLHYQQRFQHVLVDEFQDTNIIQYAWVKLLVGQEGHLMIVGDDDQSIYGWRGAKIENIQLFQRDFPRSRLIRLEQNYRSTGTILAAANHLINHNDQRLGKNLWTQDGMGEPISLYAAFNEMDEARFIVEQLQHWVNEGYPRHHAAILYRSNAQSRILEEALIQANMAYRIYGGLRFFDRAEIKDAIAYLRMLANVHDDTAFERIINTPTRGIGEQTLTAIRDYAKANNISLWTATTTLLQSNTLANRAKQSLLKFTMLIDTLAEHHHEAALFESAEKIIRDTGLYEYHQKEKGERGQARTENLEELVNACRLFIPTGEANQTPLQEFLANASLEGGEYQAQDYDDCVQLMTLHAAKGLEFPLVFISGVEEGLFPHPMSIEEPGRLEEERRLCYVGMTRAMKKLYLTYAEIRRLHGTESYHRASRFIREIPESCVREIRMKSTVTRTLSSYRPKPASQPTPPVSNPNPVNGLRMGQRVRHPKFGEGIILNHEGYGEDARIQVKFRKAGDKWLVAAYAKLEPV